MRQTLGTGMMAPLAMADNFHGNYYAGPSGAAMGALMASQAIGDGFRGWGAAKGRRQDEAKVQAEKDRLRMDELNQRQAVAQAINPMQAAESSGMGNRDMTRRMALPDANTQMALQGLVQGRQDKATALELEKKKNFANAYLSRGGYKLDPTGEMFAKEFGYNPYEIGDTGIIARAEEKQADRDFKAQMAQDQQQNARALAEIGKAAAGAAGGVKLSDLSTTRSSYMRDSGTFIAQRDGFSRVVNGAQEDNAVGDLKIIFGYMKLLDPTSVVREGEFANAENAQGVPDRVRNLYNKVANGERLVPEKRKEFVSSAYNEYKGAKSNHGNIEKSYRSLADRFQIPTEDIMPDLYSEADSQWEKFNRPKPINQYGGASPSNGRPPLESFGGK